MAKDKSAKRRSRVRALLRRKKERALLVTGAENIRYLTGFPGADSLLLVTTKGRDFFVTDPRIYGEAKRTIKGVNIVSISGTHDLGMLKDIVKKERIGTIGFESAYISYRRYRRFREALSGITLAVSDGIVEGLRMIKTEDEISRIRKSSQITKNIFARVRRYAREGATEIDIAQKIDLLIQKRGGVNAFDTIVACGPHSACPHASPSKRSIRKNDIVLMDFGAKIGHYNSDFTRAVFVGSVTRKLRKMLDVAKKAHAYALARVKPGRLISSLVAKTNRFIEDAGFGKYILHGLGHGVGLEIHEWPSLSAENRARLQSGMVFTIEPGIYVPSVGGIRVEDVVAVTERGGKILTR